MEVKATTVVEITPQMMAEAFWNLGSDGQAEFFNCLHDVIKEDHKTNPSAYSLGEMQWCHLRHELDYGHNKRGKDMHMALSAFAYDYFARDRYSQGNRRVAMSNFKDRANRLSFNFMQSIRYRGLDLIVLGEHTPADDGGRDYPSTPASLELCECWIEREEIDLTEFLTEEQWQAIQDIAEGKA